MKKICAFFMVLFVSGACVSLEQENTWDGVVRFNPADLFINLHNAIPGIYATWTPYILPNLGIPAEIDRHPEIPSATLCRTQIIITYRFMKKDWKNESISLYYKDLFDLFFTIVMRFILLLYNELH